MADRAGFPVDAVAEVLDRPVPVVAKTLRRARTALHAALDVDASTRASVDVTIGPTPEDDYGQVTATGEHPPFPTILNGSARPPNQGQ